MEGLKEAIEVLLEQQSLLKSVQLNMNPDGSPFLLLADGRATDVSHLFPPRRIKQAVSLVEAGSFAEYVNRFKNPDTLIFASVSETGASFRAILDYHIAKPADRPDPMAQYCAHVATFNLIPTPDWKAWTAANRQAMEQVKFATWLEDNQHLFIEPAGADFLELVRNLFGKKDAQFNSSVRLDNGAHSVGYSETIEVQARTGSGAINLPAQLIAEAQVFEGGLKKEIRARLKTRVTDRKLTLFFETIQMEQTVRNCILEAVKEIAEKTKIVPLLGSANGQG